MEVGREDVDGGRSYGCFGWLLKGSEGNKVTYKGESL